MNTEINNKFDLIVYDFDGVMTDNRVYLSEDGKETVLCNRSDGLAVSLIKKIGIPQIIITTETNAVVRFRAKKLEIELIHSSLDKKNDLSKYCKEKQINIKRVAYIGNDLNDLEVMKSVGFAFCPSDACSEIKAISYLCLKSKGGEGVVREFLELLRNKFYVQEEL
jgi:3-deoxy-D-manno-octulosonate 8-phosphate phosphatase (KDO 8-P phosphatase)